MMILSNSMKKTSPNFTKQEVNNDLNRLNSWYNEAIKERGASWIKNTFY